MKEVAKYYISDKFIITGRGLVFTGNAIEGEIKTGDRIQFSYDDQIVVRIIKGIEMSNHSILNSKTFDKVNTGIMIECENENEMQQIRNSSLRNIEAIIF